MNQPRNNRPMKAAAIYIRGIKEPLRDKLFFALDHFLIVAEDSEDDAPTWFNVSEVIRIEGAQRGLL